MSLRWLKTASLTQGGVLLATALLGMGLATERIELAERAIREDAALSVGLASLSAALKAGAPLGVLEAQLRVIKEQAAPGPGLESLLQRAAQGDQAALREAEEQVRQGEVEALDESVQLSQAGIGSLILLTLTGLFLVLALIRRIERELSLPLRAMEVAVEAVVRGDDRRRVSLQSTDGTLRAIALGFNHVADALDALRRANKSREWTLTAFAEARLARESQASWLMDTRGEVLAANRAARHHGTPSFDSAEPETFSDAQGHPAGVVLRLGGEGRVVETVPSNPPLPVTDYPSLKTRPDRTEHKARKRDLLLALSSLPATKSYETMETMDELLDESFDGLADLAQEISEHSNDEPARPSLRHDVVRLSSTHQRKKPKSKH